MLSKNEYCRKAKRIPSLGVGGITVSNELIYYASGVKRENAIVELGPWLGSSTAFLSIGSMFGNNSKLYTYDVWIATKTYKHRAKKLHGIELDEGQDIQPLFMNNMIGFDNIIQIKQSIFDIEWTGPPVELFIVDMGNGKIHTDCAFDKFQKHFIKDETIIFLMDYYFYDSRKADFYQYQKDLVEANPRSFKFISKPRRSRTAIFRYTGGTIKYISGRSRKEFEDSFGVNE